MTSENFGSFNMVRSRVKHNVDLPLSNNPSVSFLHDPSIRVDVFFQPNISAFFLSFSLLTRTKYFLWEVFTCIFGIAVLCNAMMKC